MQHNSQYLSDLVLHVRLPFVIFCAKAERTIPMNQSEYLGWFDEVIEPTEGMIRRVEDGFADWKLTERSFSIGQLMAHLPLAISFNARVLRQDAPLSSVREILIRNRRHPTASVEEALSMLGGAVGEFKDAVGKFTDAEFQSKIIPTPQKGNVPVWRFCAFVLEHHIHHLMELHLSLKILGIPVDTRSLYTGV